MEGMKENLMCPIHLDLLENAKTLPCQHVVCEECMALWVSKKGELLCPTCKTSHPLPAGGVANLPTNFMINGLVEEVKKMEKGDKKKSRRKSSDSDKPQKGEKKERTPQPRNADGKKSFLEKTGKVFEDICGATIKVRVQLCDSDENPIRGTKTDHVNASVISPKGKKFGAGISYQKKDGDYMVSFEPKMCGVYRMEVMLGKQNIKGSPLMVVIHPEGKFLAGVTGQIKHPKDVVDMGLSFCVTDEHDGMFHYMDWLGRQIVEVQSPQGKDSNDCNPFGIAMAGDKLYITDQKCNSVYIYNKGSYVNSFGKKYLDVPIGIAVDKSGQIFVSNQGTNEVVVFGQNLSFLKKMDAVSGKKSNSGSNAISLLALNQAEDQLVVADNAGCCLKILSLEKGEVVKTLFTRVGQATAKPFGVAIDKDDNIYVTVTFDPSEQKTGSGKGQHQGGQKGGRKTSGGDGDSEERGAVLMYNSEGYFLGRFGINELLNPGGICILEEPFLTAVVVDMVGGGTGSQGPCLKVFNI